MRGEKPTPYQARFLRRIVQLEAEGKEVEIEYQRPGSRWEYIRTPYGMYLGREFGGNRLLPTVKSMLRKNLLGLGVSTRWDWMPVYITPWGRSVLDLLGLQDFESPKSTPPIFSHREIADFLEARHEPDEWFFLRELSGYGSRVDAWAMSRYRSSKFRRVTYEIKVNRSDFLNELKQPEKRRWGLMISNEFYFVCPKGLIGRDELPPECGLMHIYESATLRIVERAPTRNADQQPSWGVVANVINRLARQVDPSNFDLFGVAE